MTRRRIFTMCIAGLFLFCGSKYAGAPANPELNIAGTGGRPCVVDGSNLPMCPPSLQVGDQSTLLTALQHRIASPRTTRGPYDRS